MDKRDRLGYSRKQNYPPPASDSLLTGDCSGLYSSLNLIARFMG
ncbi:hypothetical protein BN938_2597 [Mucinivorans hirudinis]|uniref:Uncharacterized protein n=1 Tax=Mucinivorans hirudinis TaxID=1433126 RepID=A0A060RAN7_9BACT|nr:hypothetical protein BN938_2597 [Mucinivorans hirudinis]